MMTADACSLKQLVTEPTRITSASKSLIDLMFVSHPDTFTQVGCRDVTNSDHRMTYGVYDEAISVMKQRIKKVRSFKKCVTENLISDLQEAPWHVMDTFDTIDEMWEFWKGLFLSVIDEHAPFVKVRVRPDSIPWITVEVRRLMRARNYYRNKHRKTGDPMDWERFKKLRNLVKRQLRAAKASHFKEVCNDVRPQRLWKELNKVLGRNQRQGVSVIKTSQGELSDGLRIAEEFNSYFSSCTGSFRSAMEAPAVSRVDTEFLFDDIDEEIVLRHLQWQKGYRC